MPAPPALEYFLTAYKDGERHAELQLLNANLSEAHLISLHLYSDGFVDGSFNLRVHAKSAFWPAAGVTYSVLPDTRTDKWYDVTLPLPAGIVSLKIDAALTFDGSGVGIGAIDATPNRNSADSVSCVFDNFTLCKWVSASKDLFISELTPTGNWHARGWNLAPTPYRLGPLTVPSPARSGNPVVLVSTAAQRRHGTDIARLESGMLHMNGSANFSFSYLAAGFGIDFLRLTAIVGDGEQVSLWSSETFGQHWAQTPQIELCFDAPFRLVIETSYSLPGGLVALDKLALSDTTPGPCMSWHRPQVSKRR